MMSWWFSLSILLLGAPAEAAEFPAFAEVRSAFQASDGRLLSREGELLQELRLRFEGRALPWVGLQEVSPAMREALLAVEDRRFFEHNGVDFRALAGAIWQNFSSGRHRGASTLSMQTASLLDHTSMPKKGRRGIWEKIRQGRLAWQLEREWSKEQILEAYLNLVTFRGEHRGLAAAARALFGKDPHGLDQRESFLLSALLRSPGMQPVAAGETLCLYREKARLPGDCASLKAFAEKTLGTPHGPQPRVALAPHLAHRLLTGKERELRSTIDSSLQQAAIDAVQDQLLSLNAQNARDAAVLVADNKTGELLVYVGGSGPYSASPEVDMAQSRRQAGSTLKPFLYGLAFDKGYLKPDSWLLDEPFEIGLDRGSYEPDNYDHRFHGPVPAAVALASSLNIPAVRVVDLVGVDAFQGLLDKLGFRALEEGGHYGPSLALGTPDITLFDLVQAYMTLANEGVWKPLQFKLGASSPHGKRLLSKQASREVAAVLSDRGFRALTFGWDSLLATPYPAAVKTGTSKDMRDNWCVGFSHDFTVGVWVGNSGGEPMWQVSGVSGAAPIWRSLMDRLHRGRSLKPFAPVHLAHPTFDRGKFGRILYPAPGAVLAIDPDIPEAHQRVALEAEGNQALILDGEPLAVPLWKPVRGKHHLRLAGADGAIIDELSFEVR